MSQLDSPGPLDLPVHGTPRVAAMARMVVAFHASQHFNKGMEIAMSQHAHQPTSSPLITSARATIHCLTGCVIGEVAGLAIGITLGLEIWVTIGLATGLAYISGFTLGLRPVMRDQNLSLFQAFRIIWIGEVISIGVMEIVMNAVDYSVGGMQAGSIFSEMFWYGLMWAIPAGFMAAWPVNWWLLNKNLKACH